jgi:hypothetical protein
MEPSSTGLYNIDRFVNGWCKACRPTEFDAGSYLFVRFKDVPQCVHRPITRGEAEKGMVACLRIAKSIRINFLIIVKFSQSIAYDAEDGDIRVLSVYDRV